VRVESEGLGQGSEFTIRLEELQLANASAAALSSAGVTRAQPPVAGLA
jgi:hypothetical protein